MIGLEMMAACAPNVAPQTIQEIIRVESAGNPLGLNVNTKWEDVRDAEGSPVLDEDGSPKRRRVTFSYPVEVKTEQDAVTVAYAAMAAGHSVDLGYMQVNSTNLNHLGYSVEDMFEPCKNLAAGAAILESFYRSASAKYSDEQAALRAALSAYNTGSFIRGFMNGYVERYGVTGSGPEAAGYQSPQPLQQSQPARTLAQVANPYESTTAVFIRNQETDMSNETSFIDHIPNAQENDMANEDTLLAQIETVPVISQSSDDQDIPGVQVEYDPEEASLVGAFEETAMSEQDAWESNADMVADAAGASDPHSTSIIVGGVLAQNNQRGE